MAIFTVVKEGRYAMDPKNQKTSREGMWLKVFCPDARCLTEEEIVKLPGDKQKAAQATGKDGLWLEVFCPDQGCLREEERMTVPVQSEADKDKTGVWLNIFCPDDRCVIDDPTDIA
jgi:hypothetical protein